MFFVRQVYNTPEEFGRVFDGLLIVPAENNGGFECGREFYFDKDSHLIKTIVIDVLGLEGKESIWILNCCGVKAKCVDSKDKQIQTLWGSEPFEVSKFGNDGTE